MVSYIVVTKDSAKTLGRCLRAIEAEAAATDELILVLNHSDRPTRDLAASFRWRWTIIEEEVPAPAAARNAGAAIARGDVFAFVDSDVAIGKDFRARILEQLARPWVVAGQVRITHERTPHLLTYVKRLSSLYASARFYPRRKGGRQFYLPGLYLDTACMSTKAEWFRKLGGFDVSFRYHEDTDFTLRTLREGGDIFFGDRADACELFDPDETLLGFALKCYPKGKYFPKLAAEHAVDLSFGLLHLASVTSFRPGQRLWLLALNLLKNLGLAASPFPIILRNVRSARNALNVQKHYICGVDPLVRTVWFNDRKLDFNLRTRDWERV